jgi:hypothetical protein
MTTPINEPLRIYAGDTWAWQREDLASDYPAPTWTLKYAFKNAASHIELTATADGTFFAVSVAASTTIGYTAGTYNWVAYVESGSSRYTVDEGVLVVLPAFANASALDNRTHAKKALDAIEAVIEGRAGVDQMEYTIGSRQLKRMPIAELLQFRDYYRAQVFAADANERRRNGYGAGRVVARL